MGMILTFLWLLLWPAVAALCVAVHVRHTDAKPGRLNAGYAAVYAIGTIILLTMHYV